MERSPFEDASTTTLRMRVASLRKVMTLLSILDCWAQMLGLRLDAQRTAQTTKKWNAIPGYALSTSPSARTPKARPRCAGLHLDSVGGHIWMDEGICLAQDMDHPVNDDQGSWACSWDSKPLNETGLSKRVLETLAEQDGSVHTMAVTCNGLSDRGFRDLEEEIETPLGTDNWNIGSNIFTPWLKETLYAL